MFDFLKNPDTDIGLIAKRLTIPFMAVALCGCGTVQTAADKVTEFALSSIGFKVPEKPDVAIPPRPVRIKLMAAQDLNAGADGRGLSVIFRLYKLKSQNAFLAAPYATFGNVEKEKDAMGTDIIEVKELTLSPGQTVDLKEVIPAEAAYVGAVSLFRAPSTQRWRFAFASNDAILPGITIGLHACAMTATSTPPSGMALSESQLLSPTKCE